MRWILRLWHAITWHQWTIHLQDVRRATVLMHLCTWAGCYVTCPCGSREDDLSNDARNHFLARGQLVLDRTGKAVLP
jgi:hypothetical protein